MSHYKTILYGITALLFVTIITAVSNAETINPPRNSDTDFNSDIEYIYSIYSKELLLNDEWNVRINGSKFKAFHYDRYNNRHSLLTIEIEASHGSGYDLFTAKTHINEKITVKSLKIPTDGKRPREQLLKNIVVTYLVMKTFDFRKETKRRSDIAFHPSIAFGYIRTSEWDRNPKDYRDGNAFISVSLIYDPALELMEESMHLSTGDYMSIELLVAFNSGIKENYFDMNMLLYGNITNLETLGRRFRMLHGFFVGLEYMRPSYDEETMKLNGQIASDRIALQFLSAKIIQYGLVASFGTKNNQTISLMAGFGPSVNSSLVATVNPTIATPHSNVFISQTAQQNYYFSISSPVTLSYKIDRVYGFSTGLEYNFYYFTYPDLSENAVEIVNVFKYNLGYNIIGGLFINARYEYWHISSRVSDEKLYHTWGRIFLEMKYQI